jgi:hypothetical protein
MFCLVVVQNHFALAIDTFALGDTLLLEMNFSHELTDEQGGVKNSFPNYDFRLELGCGRIDVDPPLSQDINFLTLSTTVGKDSTVILSQSGISYYIIKPIFDNGIYSFKSELIVRKEGLYVLDITPYESPSEPFSIKGECDHVTVRIGSKLENDEQNNFHMYQWAANPVYHTFDEKRFRDYGGYCFVVRP